MSAALLQLPHYRPLAGSIGELSPQTTRSARARRRQSSARASRPFGSLRISVRFRPKSTPCSTMDHSRVLDEGRLGLDYVRLETLEEAKHFLALPLGNV